jgi:predicted Zn-ribbon and HTH transcriptional regulator
MKDMPLIKMEGFQCNRCGYKWTSQIYTHKNPPIACSKCKSAYWNRERNTYFTMEGGQILDKE